MHFASLVCFVPLEVLNWITGKLFLSDTVFVLQLLESYWGLTKSRYLMKKRFNNKKNKFVLSGIVLPLEKIVCPLLLGVFSSGLSPICGQIKIFHSFHTWARAKIVCEGYSFWKNLWGVIKILIFFTDLW